MENIKKQPNAVWQGALIGIKLLLICAIIAALISFVYAITLDKYNENLTEQKRIALNEIFKPQSEITYEQIPVEDGILYTVREGEKQLGYCVEIASGGFGGDIALMVGFDANGTIFGVSVVSHAETPGLGAKVDDSTYLSQYIGKSGTVTLGEDVDAIGGATISSRAVLDGVNRASAQVASYLASVKGGENNA